ncbi:hypothetical protein [Bacillus coahuilensis]|uniref:hypothetical protein n=1 Tax=Bacillus coahuilensis TaxID=408580 RepID=UPI00018509C7|nr:hypothetical protein [Bacillus coahuilensis]
MELCKINFESIQKITHKAINRHIQYQQKDFDETYSTLETYCIKFSLLHKPTDDLLTVNRAMNQIYQLKEKLSNIENQIVALQTVKGEVKALNEIVTSKLTNLTEKQYFDLADLLISNVQVHDDYVLLSYFFNDFFEKGA